MADKTTCANEDHARPVPAVARMLWPDGRYRPWAACATDLRWFLRDSIDDGHVVLVEPLVEHEPHGYLNYTVTHAIKELMTLRAGVTPDAAPQHLVDAVLAAWTLPVATGGVDAGAAARLAVAAVLQHLGAVSASARD